MIISIQMRRYTARDQVMHSALIRPATDFQLDVSNEELETMNPYCHVGSINMYFASLLTLLLSS